MGMKKGWSSFMDRRVKERLVGATILVVLIVLIVPELLSGPKQSRVPSTSAGTSADAVRNVTVDLDTRKATADAEAPAPASAAVAPPDAPAPPTVTTLQAQPSPPLENGGSTPNSQSGPVVGMGPTVAAGAAAGAGANSDGAHHRWAVQLGSFASQANAQRLIHQLKGQGFSAYIMPGGGGAGSLYRVRIGPLADRVSAERMISRLSKVGHSASVVSP